MSGAGLSRMILKRAIVCPPGPSFHKGITTLKNGPPDYQTAVAQHEGYCAVLEQCGLSLTRLIADPAYPDSTFVEDTAVIVDSDVILAQPGTPSRSGEVAAMNAVVRGLFRSIHAIQLPGTLDGGDVCQANNHFFIGVSQRTNEVGAQQLAQLLMDKGYKSTLVDIRNVKDNLHLKSGLAYIGDSRLIVTATLAERKEFHQYELIQVPLGAEYAANCLRVNDYVLVPSGFRDFETSLAVMGYQVIAVEVSEFQKMDGGLSCLSLRF